MLRVLQREQLITRREQRDLARLSERDVDATHAALRGHANLVTAR
jgi:hypothetical protein